MNVAERMKTWREWAGFERYQIAEAMDLSEQAIRNWEGEANAPTLAHLERFATILGLTLEQFFGPVPGKRGAA